MKPFTRQPGGSVAALGEEELIREIRRWLGRASPQAPFGIGDDCAVLPRSRTKQLITVDPVIYGRHFDDRIPPRGVGAKLLKRNLSDLAAMGGRPTAAVLALTLDARVSVAWLAEFYRGLAACAREYRVPIVGGDIAEADGVLAANLTLLGEATGPRIVTRAGARIGDWIMVTGALGSPHFNGHHFRFRPRLAEGAWLARQKAVRSMMDLSDGLAKDIWALTPEKGYPAIFAERLPRRTGATVENAVSAGEDYELVFALSEDVDPARFARAWTAAFPQTRLSLIGKFVRRRDLFPNAMDLAAYRGYEHLTGA